MRPNIGDHVFYSCNALGSVIIGSGVRSFGLQAFTYEPITNLIMSAYITNIPGEAFNLCGVNNATVPGNFGQSDFIHAFAGCATTNVTVANGALTIQNGLFEEAYQIASVVLPASLTSIGTESFYLCEGITNITIPSGVTNIGAEAFHGCSALNAIFFGGNPPNVDASTFAYDSATAYYLPGTTGWSNTLAGIPAVLWNPVAQPGSFGVSNNQFGFNITGTPNIPVAVDACTNLSNPFWTPLKQLTLTNGLAYFSDPQWMNFPCRFYRIRSPH